MKHLVAAELVHNATAAEAQSLHEPSDYYSTLISKARVRTEFSPETVFVIPLASFMARMVHAVLSHPEVRSMLPKEIAERVKVGRQVIKTAVRHYMAQGLFSHYRTSNGFSDITTKTDRNPLGLSIYGESIVRDVGWAAGGVVRAVQDGGHPQSPLEVMLTSRELQLVGWLNESTAEAAQIGLGQPYIHPRHITFVPVRRVGHTPVEAIFTPEARQYLHIDPSDIGCPVRRLGDPSGIGTVFQAEWANMATLLMSNDATADRPITSLDL